MLIVQVIIYILLYQTCSVLHLLSSSYYTKRATACVCYLNSTMLNVQVCIFFNFIMLH